MAVIESLPLPTAKKLMQTTPFAEVICNLPAEKLLRLATLLDAYLPLSQKEELLLKLT